MGVAFSEFNPIYEFSKITLGPTNPIILTLLRLGIGFITVLMGMSMISILAICLLVTIHGIVTLYLWTIFIIPPNVQNPADSLPFHLSQRIYTCLRIMTLQQGEFARFCIFTCMHHAHLVTMSTCALYYFLIQFSPGHEISTIVTLLCGILILFCAGLEYFAVGVMAKASSASKEYIRGMKFVHGMNKYEKKVLRSVLPNCINLELIGSLDTIKNGIRMSYFLNFWERVTDNTMNLLLARN